MAMVREIDPVFSSFTHLKNFPRQDEALRYLKRIASLVKPLMRARGWKVGTLSEMYPDQANLLGLNVDKGRQILIRLREPFDRTHFLPFEKMVDTMLHELSHNVHGPHDQKFNALWNQLREELEGLMMKGYTGEGFLGKGQRLGGRNIPYHEALRLARADAQRRRPQATAFGGYRLGGTAPRPGEDLRSAILESIERRRNTSELGCANNNRNEREIQAISQTWTKNGFRTQAEEDAANEAAIAQALWELVQEDEKRKYGNSYLPPSAQNPFGNGGGVFLQDLDPRRGTDFVRNAQRPPPIPTATRPPARPISPERRDFWACGLCTLHNPLHATTCDACGTRRPTEPSRTGSREVIDLTESPPKKKPKPARASAKTVASPPISPRPATWRCSLCSNVMENQWWTCSLCGKMKESS